MARATDGLNPTSMTPIRPDNVDAGVKPPGMTPVPGQQIPTPPVPATPDAPKK